MSERRGFRDFVDRLTSVAAIITAVAAVGIAVYEAHITREQQKKSVWPYVMQYNTYGGQDYLRFVENAGLGPAIVSSFEIRVGDSTYTRWEPVVTALTGSDTAFFIYSSFGDGPQGGGPPGPAADTRRTERRPVRRAPFRGGDRRVLLLALRRLLDQRQRRAAAEAGGFLRLAPLHESLEDSLG